jgi:hypothetical protein
MIIFLRVCHPPHSPTVPMANCRDSMSLPESSMCGLLNDFHSSTLEPFVCPQVGGRVMKTSSELISVAQVPDSTQTPSKNGQMSLEQKVHKLGKHYVAIGEHADLWLGQLLDQTAGYKIVRCFSTSQAQILISFMLVSSLSNRSAVGSSRPR